MSLCGLEIEAIIVSLGSKELGINLFLMKKEAGYWKLKVILFNVYLPVCSSSRILLPKLSQRSSDSCGILGCGWSLWSWCWSDRRSNRALLYLLSLFLGRCLNTVSTVAGNAEGEWQLQRQKMCIKNNWGFTRLKQRASDELQSQKSVQQTNLFSEAQSLTMILYRLVALSMSWHMQCMYFKLEKKIWLCQTCVFLLPFILFL